MPRPAARRPGNPLNDAMGEYLAAWPWAHYLTLTFRDPLPRPSAAEPLQLGRFHRVRDYTRTGGVGLDYALRRWRRFLHELELVNREPLFWFYGIEHGDRTGRLHLHALTGNTEGLERVELAARWTAGHSRILTYDPRRGAGYYVAKYVSKELSEWDLSRNALGYQSAQHRLPLQIPARGAGNRRLAERAGPPSRAASARELHTTRKQ